MEKMEKSNKDKSYLKNNNNLKEQQKMEKSPLEPLEKQKKNRKRKPNSERDKQKAELERSEGELKKLLAQFGSKAKVADDIDRDTSKLRDSIVELMAKARSRSNINTKTRHDAALRHNFQHHQNTTTPTTLTSLFFIIWNSLMSLFTMIIHPIQALYQYYEKVYTNINWSLFLTIILLLELSIIGFIWKIKRIQYTYMYVEPYEAVVHGTFGVETTSWSYLSSFFDLIFDFVSEMRYGGRSFGSASYDGFVPI